MLKLDPPREGAGHHVLGVHAQPVAALLNAATAAVAQDGIEMDYPGGHFPREAARLAANMVRQAALDAAALGEDWPADLARGAAPITDPEVGAAINLLGAPDYPYRGETVHDAQFAAGMAVLRGARGMPEPAARGVQYVGRWLVEPAPAAAGHLVRWVDQHARDWNPGPVFADPRGPRFGLIARAWWRIHGTAVVGRVATPGTPGRPTRDAAAVRAALRHAVVRTWAAGGGDLTKAALADRAGVSRPTLDAWLKTATA